MSAVKDTVIAIWPDDGFWSSFDRLESRHQRAQSAHESLRLNLENLRHEAASDNLYEAWRRYCEVIAELDRSTADMESFRSQLAR